MSLFIMGLLHSALQKKRDNKPLWKHVMEKHGGVLQVPMFSHYKMKLTNIFSEPQRRKAHEGVGIVHLDPDTRMNSKLEFLQGSNLFLQPVRVVGV